MYRYLWNIYEQPFIWGGGKVQDVTLNSTNNCLTIHYTSGDTTDVALAKASEVLDGLMSKEDKAKLDSLSGNYSSSLSSTVSTVEKLGGIAAGTNYAWDGTQWDPLGGTIDLSGYYTKSQVDGAISEVKTELEATDTDLQEQITTVTNQLNNKVDKVEGSGLISDTDLNQIRTNKSNIESLQTSVEDKQDLLTAGEAITISEENTIDLKLDAATDSALSKSADGLKLDLTGLKGSTIKIGTAITGGVDVGADQTIVAGMQALSNSIQTAVSGGITSLTSPDETLTISGSGTSRSLVVNVAKIVSANSAIQVGTDGKLDIFWNEIS